MRYSRIVLGIMFVVVTTSPVCFGQASRAVLDDGPILERGLLFLPVNVIAYYRGEYTIGDLRVRVLFTRSDVSPYPEWTDYRCSSLLMKRIPVDGESLLIFVAVDPDWRLFVEFPNDSDSVCAFVSTFLTRFRYFLGVDRSGSGVPPFPAILTL